MLIYLNNSSFRESCIISLLSQELDTKELPIVPITVEIFVGRLCILLIQTLDVDTAVVVIIKPDVPQLDLCLGPECLLNHGLELLGQGAGM